MTDRRSKTGFATRRQFLTATAVTPVVARTGAALAQTPDPAALIRQDLERYIGFGEKRSGGAGDNACGDWMEQSLADLGFETQRQSFSAPFSNRATARSAPKAERRMSGLNPSWFPRRRKG